MKKYLEEVKGRISSLQIRFVQIPREENEWPSVEYMLIPDQVLSFVQVSLLIDKGRSMQELGSERN